jgi:hypothetical protein
MYEALTALIWVAVISYIVIDQRRLRHNRQQKLHEMYEQAKWLQNQPSPLADLKEFAAPKQEIRRIS